MAELGPRPTVPLQAQPGCWPAPGARCSGCWQESLPPHVVLRVLAYGCVEYRPLLLVTWGCPLGHSARPLSSSERGRSHSNLQPESDACRSCSLSVRCTPLIPAHTAKEGVTQGTRCREAGGWGPPRKASWHPGAYTEGENWVPCPPFAHPSLQAAPAEQG